MNYCSVCGTKLENRDLEHEGVVKFCPACKEFKFPTFSTAVSMVVVSKDFKHTLLIEQYNKKKYILVAGYINKGESAEEALKRELFEEVSLVPWKITFQKTKYFEKTNTLMLNYIVLVENENVKPNYEIDDYAWFDIEEARNKIAHNSLAQEFYEMFYEKVLNNEI